MMALAPQSVEKQNPQAVGQEGGFLRVEGLSKKIGPRWILKDVSIQVGAGELVGLLGPNGAGKSTTFKLITGLMVPSTGSVVFDGKTWVKQSLARRVVAGLGYLPQESSIFRQMSVRGNLQAALESRGLRGESLREELATLEERFHLNDLAIQLAETLSGGERRRLEIARAVALKPKILLLDEPFAGVDPVSIDELIGFIRMLKQEGMGILLTDHNVYEALPLCDRAVILFGGKVMTEGLPQELMKDKLVQKFYLGTRFSRQVDGEV